MSNVQGHHSPVILPLCAWLLTYGSLTVWPQTAVQKVALSLGQYAQQSQSWLVRLPVTRGFLISVPGRFADQARPAGRMMKHLAAMGTVREVDTDRYVPTPLSHALTKPMFRASLILMCVARCREESS